jgi:hypothetical protein
MMGSREIQVGWAPVSTRAVVFSEGDKRDSSYGLADWKLAPKPVCIPLEI